MTYSLRSLARSVAPALVGLLLVSGPALSQEWKLNTLSKPVTLKAIPQSDNGKSIGMAATFGNTYLSYKAFHGRLTLRYVGQFDQSRLPPPNARRYAAGLEGAAIYQVENADQFLADNHGRLFLGTDVKPTFVTLKQGVYVDGKKATWVCVLSSTSVDEFYRTQIGHERCDAFR